MDATRRLLTLVLLGATALAATACKESEQDRVLIHEKGVYQGEADTPLKEETLDDLRQRARNQAG